MQIKLINEINPKYTPTEQIMTNRGIPYEKVESYMNTTDADINSFLDLDNIEEAVDTIFKHIEKNSRILIEVDCDVDGYTSAALLYNYLKANYPEVRIEYNVHDYKRHGLDMTDNVLNNKYDLIIVPDAGSNEYNKHKKLHELGIDCIVLDHHEADKYSEHAIVVNNQLSNKYKNKNLSGVGVVWQFCRAIDHFSIKTQAKSADDYLDLVAVGLVADMMDLRDFETRRLVDKGLNMINSHSSKGNKFLKAIVDYQSYPLGNGVTPIGISFYIAPFINAVTRVGTHAERIATFECFLDEMADDELPSTKRGSRDGDIEIRTEQGIRVMNNIRNRQKREQDKGAETFGGHIDQDYLDNNSLIILDTGGTVVKDLNGLIANQMQSKYQRPTLVLRETDEGLIEGSGRGHPTSEMEDFREFIRESGYAEFAEGHANAFGTAFTKENFEKFKDYANEKLDYQNAHHEYTVDYIIDFDEIDSDMILEIAKLKNYWGQGVEEPYIYFKNVRINQNSKLLMKSNTLKLMAKDIPCIQFRAPEGAFEELAPNEYTDSIVDIVGKPNLNEFNGQVDGQIFISEYKIVGSKTNF